MIKPKSENEIQNEILMALEMKQAGFFWRQNSVGVFSRERNIFLKQKGRFHILGVSDILGVIDSRFIAIEVKTKSAYTWSMNKYTKYKIGIGPTNKKEEHVWNQFHFMSNIIKNGGVAFFSFSHQHAVEQLLLEGFWKK